MAPRTLALLLGLLASPPTAAAGFGAMLGVSSDNVFRGISESGGNPAVQAGGYYAWNGGAVAGLRAASIEARTATGRVDAVELDAYLGFTASPVADWSTSVMLIHYARPWHTTTRPGYDELAVSATWRGRVSLAVAASPDRPVGGRRDASYAYEAALRWPIAAAVSLDAGAGYYDLSRLIGSGYAYWSAGATYARRRLSIRASWIGTDGNGRELYGATADDRLVASALWTF